MNNNYFLLQRQKNAISFLLSFPVVIAIIIMIVLFFTTTKTFITNEPLNINKINSFAIMKMPVGFENSIYSPIIFIKNNKKQKLDFRFKYKIEYFLDDVFIKESSHLFEDIINNYDRNIWSSGISFSKNKKIKWLKIKLTIIEPNTKDVDKDFSASFYISKNEERK
ncbi:MAG: hypothetical protein ACK5LP_10585 [Campylobacteraceae bacterium]